ncbi:hypothetical protein ACIA8G_28720 [Lentzea sp. NPDC051213]|uniref:nSTAND1 domain-containing NTPase n=1 Tax=Lentzea sp. NPDC051213 TaxID=3364126 RepID=UPI003795F942
MPRTERPLDSEDTELGRFAADLRTLREKAGKPSYRALGSRAHYSAATLSDAAGGKKLPSLAVTLAYVTACGGDPQEWEQRWRDIAAPPEPTGEAPYVGLKAFQKEDADRFHGRENLTAKLVQLTTGRRFVGVFGASGSGKSSLLRAGLLPRLPQALIFTPGVNPLDECAVRLAQLTGHSAVVLRSELTDPEALGLLVKQHDEQLVLVIDQFEEIFTLCGQEQRDWFVKALTSAPHVVVGVRADFYGHVGRHPELVEALEGAQLLVGPMTTDELRRAITEPAQHVGATVETALVTRLVADVAGQAAALPLVQHALVETWHRRRGMTLSLAGYEEAGGVEHAIARTAESVYERLTEEQQQIARGIFLRLIALGEGTEDTKRRATREDLDAEVLEHLANARLVTLTEQHAELTHEALIRSWPRLRDWIAEDRDALRVHHQLTEAAAAWDGDRDLLYKGVRLAQAGELNPDSLTEPERDFLTASQADGRRRTRRARAVVSVLSVLVLLLAGTVVFAVDRAREASRREGIAVAVSAATQARSLMELHPDQAVRLALAVHAVAPSEENRDLLLTADAAARRKRLEISPYRGTFSKITGGRFYVASDGRDPAQVLWDLRSNASRPHLTLSGTPVFASDDDRRLVVSRDGADELLDISDPGQPRKLAEVPAALKPSEADGGLNTFAGLVPTHGGSNVQPTVWRYDGSGGVREIVVPGDRRARDLRLSRDGRTLAVAREGSDGVELWQLDGDAPRLAGKASANPSGNPVGFSPDGRFLLIATWWDGFVQVWDVSDPAHPMRWADLPQQQNAGLRFEFSPDSGRVLLANDRSARVWDLRHKNSAEQVAAFENLSDDITGIDFWPASNEFVALLRNDTLWPLRTDADQVVRDMCLGGAALSDPEWRKYFPDVDRVPVC